MAVPLELDLPSDHYTVEDWLHLPETVGQRIELIDGSFVVSPTPLSNHQVCAGRLRTLLAAAASHDLEVVEAFGVRTASEVPVPDVVVGDGEVLLSGATVLLPEQTHLVAEIVSPSHRQRDYHDKPRIYAAAGIPTFLRIELAGVAPPYVEVFHLHDGAYTLVAKANAGQTLELTRPFPVAFDPGRLLGRRAG
ncbi:Uma2 family endonuclease [Actinoallomurus sp. NBC_01490]|uniref:Uma2 family endonuclease n=1 Tax=Actinoallomurus sp. NBC_01490 TaxID=2903557 RepID=UPI002E362ED7|nr:Uma2 family endonuclease [Actinoallomurus sp. NBC_01490]